LITGITGQNGAYPEDFLLDRGYESNVQLHAGIRTEVHLSNLEAKRDGGNARDYVRATWLTPQ